MRLLTRKRGPPFGASDPWWPVSSTYAPLSACWLLLWQRLGAQGLKAQQYLDRHDAFSFFEPLGDLVVTGPTFTNVNDFRALLVL